MDAYHKKKVVWAQLRKAMEEAPGSSAHGSDSAIAATSAAGNPSAATMKHRRSALRRGPRNSQR